GLGFITMSTPPVLADATGTCSAYKPECIGEAQKVLFYTALALIVMGMAGHSTSLNSLMIEHATIKRQTQEEEEVQASQIWSFCFGMFGMVIVYIAIILAITFIKPWSLRLGIPAICTVIATTIFLTSSCSYKCLDKAAIIVQSESLEQQEKNKWRLCRVSEVEETKSMICMIPICLSFLVVGLVSSLGNTFFIEQANHMNQKVGKLTVPIPIFLWFYDQSKSYYASSYSQFARSLSRISNLNRGFVAQIGIAVSMIFAILCSITAAKVEERRLGVVVSHGLVDKPEETVPMTMFWLLPQYLLLGGLDGILENNITRMLANQLPQTMAPYVTIFASGISGVGILASVLSVYVVGKASSKGIKPSWFQYTLNKSRLDKYYWLLAILCVVNLVFFILMAIWYARRDSKSEDREAPEVNVEINNEPFEDDAQS
ncbi:hypothetical protein F8388_015759, partial [Cannabis sativa]